MRERRPTDPDAEVLPAKVAERLITRASELDAAFTSGATLAELRAAAAEAGISSRAFDAAVAEMRVAEEAPPVAQPKSRKRPALMALAAGIGVLFLASTALVSVRASSGDASAVTSMVEEAIVLRCVTAREAIGLVRPVRHPSTTLTIRPEAPRILRVRGTDAQIRDIRSVLAPFEGDGASCPRALVPGDIR
jgi:hypothetical protein